MPSHIPFSTVDLPTLLSDPSVQQLLDLVHLHPEWSPKDLATDLAKSANTEYHLTEKHIRTILRRLHLQTLWRRRLHHTNISTVDATDDQAVKDHVLSTFPSLADFLKYRHARRNTEQPSPSTVADTPQFTRKQQVTFHRMEKFFALSKQFTVVFLLSFLFFLGGSFGLSSMLHAQSTIARIGFFFSFTALVCGLFFFLYSLKYYFTIAMVLSFSRYEEEHSAAPRNGLLKRLFGEVAMKNAEYSPKQRATGVLVPEANLPLSRYPFVSVQVATYNEKRVIDRFLLAATALDYSHYEILVADDSTDESVALLEAWKRHPRVKVSHRDTRDGYKGAALAEALTKMDPRTEFVLIFDADFIPYPDAITQFLQYFQHHLGNLDPESLHSSPLAAVQGYQWHILNKSENWITRGVRSEYSGSYIIERTGDELYQGLKQIAGSVYMIRRDALEAVGWGTSITEDFELTLNLYARGYKVLYTPYIQAPAEAVSTVKRLIRQRMRWAEGHSFNVKRMWKPLLASPHLTLMEKAEFVYLAPYYLQAFLFLVGTFCWVMAEVVLQTRLPFWTDTWGWSLVLTNLLSIPLMNFVGLLLEDSDEHDYVGLLSFLALSYLLAPFQAFAAVKGFLEKEEGPWFRTPKTGHITENFVQNRMSRFLHRMWQRNDPSPALLSVPPDAKRFAFQSALRKLRVPHRRLSWLGKSVLSLFLIVTFTLALMPNTKLVQQANASFGGTGTGADGAITISGTTNCQTTAIASGRSQPDCSMTFVSSTSNSGQATLNVNATTGFAANDEALIIGILGTNQGKYEFQTIASVGSGTLTLTKNLANTWSFTSGTTEAMVVRVPQYTNVTISSGGTLTVSAYNSSSHVGGILVFRATGTVQVNSGGKVLLDGLGFAGGAQVSGGVGSAGANGTAGTAGNPGAGPGAGGGGGSGGTFGSHNSSSGGGAGGSAGGGGGAAYGASGTAGSAGTASTGGSGGGTSPGSGGSGNAGTGGSVGSSYGIASLSSLYYGSGGGSGASGAAGGGSSNSLGNPGGAGGDGGAGGTGGGILYISANSLSVSGTVSSKGSAGASGNAGSDGGSGGATGGGGGGAPGASGGGGTGGSIYLRADTVTLGTNLVTASGGSAGSSSGLTGGNGGDSSFSTGGAGSAGAGGGGAGSGSSQNGSAGTGGGVGSAGSGSVGRIHIDYGTSLSGTTSPSADTTQVPEELLLFAPLFVLIPSLVALIRKRWAQKHLNAQYLLEPERRLQPPRKRKPPG